jgi:hypothetical protein
LAAETLDPVETVHVRVCPPLGSGTEPGREAQKLHPVRNAWMAVAHVERISYDNADTAPVPVADRAWRYSTHARDQLLHSRSTVWRVRITDQEALG